MDDVRSLIVPAIAGVLAGLSLWKSYRRDTVQVAETTAAVLLQRCQSLEGEVRDLRQEVADLRVDLDNCRRRNNDLADENLRLMRKLTAQ